MDVRIGFLLALVFLVMLPASAWSGSPTWGVAAGPVLQELRGGPGETVRAVVEVKNPGTALSDVRFVLYDLSPEGELRPAGSTPHTLVGRIAVPTSLTLKPGEIRRLVLPVTIDAVTRYGALMVLGGPPVAPAAGVVLRIVAVPPTARPVPSVEAVPARDGAVKVIVANIGGAVLRARGNLFLLKEGNLVGRLSIPPLIVLPGGTETLVLRWPRPLEAGVEARVALTALIDGKPVLVTGEGRVR
jgi:hypothetical protein